LQQLGVTNPAWLTAVSQHHERFDGSGYPAGLSAETITREARLIAVADVYAAMVIEHAHRRAYAANVALKEIYL
jgi:HD-GYP domain-containing protein (c-di-GMP phosphodiesterase class II)